VNFTYKRNAELTQRALYISHYSEIPTHSFLPKLRQLFIFSTIVIILVTFSNYNHSHCPLPSSSLRIRAVEGKICSVMEAAKDMPYRLLLLIIIFKFETTGIFKFSESIISFSLTFLALALWRAAFSLSYGW
jgi:hypothetical protein